MATGRRAAAARPTRGRPHWRGVRRRRSRSGPAGTAGRGSSPRVALAAASQKQKAGGNQDDGTHDLPVDEAEPSEIGDQEVSADHDQDDAEPEPPRSVTMGGS